jgi:N-acetylmuramoyl-L-alanine amidase
MRAIQRSRTWTGCLIVGVSAVLLAGCSSTTTHIAGAPVGGATNNTPTVTATTPTRPPTTHATPTTDPATADSSLAGKVVAIDPGHDGGNENDPEAINKLVPEGPGETKACDTTGTNAVNGYTEHAFNFDVALRVKAMLQSRGIRVVMTRTNDTGVGPCVNVRAAIGNNAKADAAVSIHGDGYDGGGHGFQVIEANASAGGQANDAASHRLAVAMHASLINVGGLVPATYIGTNGYEDRSDLAGLNLSTRPKVLVECGNMRDPGDAAMMESAAGREKIARAIAAGIETFLLSQH